MFGFVEVVLRQPDGHGRLLIGELGFCLREAWGRVAASWAGLCWALRPNEKDVFVYFSCSLNKKKQNYEKAPGKGAPEGPSGSGDFKNLFVSGFLMIFTVLFCFFNDFDGF